MENGARCASCGAPLADAAWQYCPRCGMPVLALDSSRNSGPRVFLAPEWARTQTALSIMHAGLTTTFLGALGIGAGIVVPFLRQISLPAWQNSGGNSACSVLLLVPGILAVFGGWVVTLVAQCTACMPPTVARARNWAVGALALGLVARLLGGLTLVILAFPDPNRANAILSPSNYVGLTAAASALAGLAEVVYTVLYLRALAQALGEELLARRSAEFLRFFLTFMGLLCAADVFAVPLLNLLPGESTFKMSFVPIGLLCEAFCLLILFSNLITLVRDTRDAIARAHNNNNGPEGQAPLPGRHEL